MKRSSNLVCGQALLRDVRRQDDFSDDDAGSDKDQDPDGHPRDSWVKVVELAETVIGVGPDVVQPEAGAVSHPAAAAAEPAASGVGDHAPASDAPPDAPPSPHPEPKPKRAPAISRVKTVREESIRIGTFGSCDTMPTPGRSALTVIVTRPAPNKEPCEQGNGLAKEDP